MTTLETLKLAQEALRHSIPVQAHYPEPVKRHTDALTAVTSAIEVIESLHRVLNSL